jgi:three-Cys-motif partner protein
VPLQMFGGDWTEEKLRRLQKYLKADNVALKNQPFTREYIDAFAGTGYREVKQPDSLASLLLPELVEEDCQDFLDGSASIALKVEPPFHKFTFIERKASKFDELCKLKDRHPDREIVTLRGDANEHIRELCRGSWDYRRAVLFLDPFGMQVTWETIKAVASTRAIDMWLLFPLGVAVSRLLKKDGDIEESLRRSLDVLFGESSWFDAFYKIETAENLFRQQQQSVYKVDFRSMERYFIDRLRSIFPGVAENPLQLLNSRNVPLYLLCFAAGNAKGAPIAVGIAQNVLK